jgi:hypothetical protein
VTRDEARVARFFLVQAFQIGKKCTKRPQNIPKGQKYIPNGHKIYQHLPFEGPPKFTQIWDVWFENKPTGNPG